MNQPLKDEELELIYPPEKSMSGRNSTYRFCEARGQSAAYAVCLHTLKAIDENRLDSNQAIDCQRAYCHGQCVAADMRKEEIAAKQALYYVERRAVIINGPAKEETADHNKSSGKYDLNNESYARGWAQVGSKIHGEARQKRPAYVPPPKPKSGFVEHDAAAVLNSMMEKKDVPDRPVHKVPEQVTPQPAPAAPTTTPETSLSPLPGETPLAFAKRRAQLLMKANK